MTKDEILNDVDALIKSLKDTGPLGQVYNDGFKDGAKYALQKLEQCNVISSANTSWNRCKHCGRFISYEEMQNGEAIHKFMPDTYFTDEQNYWVHRHCL